MSLSEKLDLYKKNRTDYSAPKKPEFITVEKDTYLTIEGVGEPGGETYEARVATLYAMAYSMKMASKKAGRDYGVCKMEAIWWGPSGEAEFHLQPRENWHWKLLIRTPDFIDASALQNAVEQLEKKGKGAHTDLVALESLEEGNCVQMLHEGPYHKEGETVAIMKDFAESQGLSFRGFHHEIYLSDPRRVPEERLKTILRQPVE